MGYTQTQAKEFINTIAPLIQAESKKRGYSICSTVIAQAMIEGACGTSKLAQEPYNNHFGMKCGAAWLKAGKPSVNMRTKEEYKVGTLVSITDYFRSYPNGMQECVAGYYDFISAKRYDNLKTATTYREYAERLKADGYATSSSYINTLCSMVEKYNLQSYDNSVIPTYIKSRRVLKKGMSGSDVVLIQTILHNQMYDIGKCGADGIFGKDTEKAVRQFQQEKGLVVDGICGAKTWIMLEKYN